MTPKNTNYQKLFEAFAKDGILIPETLKTQITDQLNDKINYEPKIGIFGKTGVGKSSLCNAVFGRDVCPISDIESCTREPQELFLAIGKSGLKLVDVPGIGENDARDNEYHALYTKLIPELDLILWILKADDRAFSAEEKFYKCLVSPYIAHGKPFFIIINQIDKIEPFQAWDVEARRPDATQEHNIQEKRKAVSNYFNLPLDQILAVSANEKYGLIELVDAIVHALPKDKKLVVLNQVVDNNISKSASQEAKAGWLDTVSDIIETTVGKAATYIIKKVATIVSRIWQW